MLQADGDVVSQRVHRCELDLLRWASGGLWTLQEAQDAQANVLIDWKSWENPQNRRIWHVSRFCDRR